MIPGYTTARQTGLGGIPLAAVPVAIEVAKNNFGWLTRLFGGKLVHGLKEEEFNARHNDPHWFQALWYDGYWFGTGAGEIPAGMSVQDYWVRRFGIGPLIPSDQRLARARSRGIPDSSWRLTSIPPGMPWPTDVAVFRQDEIERVLPRQVPPSVQTGVPTIVAGLGGTLPILLAVAVGAYLLLSRK